MLQFKLERKNETRRYSDQIGRFFENSWEQNFLQKLHKYLEIFWAYLKTSHNLNYNYFGHF